MARAERKLITGVSAVQSRSEPLVIGYEPGGQSRSEADSILAFENANKAQCVHFCYFVKCSNILFERISLRFSLESSIVRYPVTKSVMLHSNFSFILTRFRDIAAFVFQHATFSHLSSSLPKISP